MLSNEELKEKLKLLKENIVIGESYKYKDLCSIMMIEPKKDNSKKAQLNWWRCLFRWDNPTSQRYVPLEIYDDPKEVKDGRKDNGGVRVGAGNKAKLKHEFNCLLNGFLQQEWQRNDYNFKAVRSVAYFSNSKISKYFGLYSENFFNGRDGNEDIFNLVYGKLGEKRRDWIVNKIDKIEEIDLGYGIVAYKNKNDWNNFEYRDDLESDWLKYQKEYYDEKNKAITDRSNKLRCEGDVAKAGLWEEMEDFISDKFDDYERVKRVHKAAYDIKFLQEFDMSEIGKCRFAFNNACANEVVEYFRKNNGKEKKDKSGKLVKIEYDVAAIEKFIDMYVRL